jgi:predicted MPP superfamily phosphohydrolase
MIPQSPIMILLFLLVTAGWLQIFISLQNRLWSRRWPRDESRWVDRCYQLGTIFSPFIAWLGVQDADRELHVRTLSMIPEEGRWCIVAAGAVGLVIRGLATSRWWLSRVPAAVISKRSSVHEFQSPDSYGDGPGRGLLSLPANQSFQCEFVEIDLALSGLPEAWDEMSILHLTDTHFRGGLSKAWFERLFETARNASPDMVVFTGDLLDNLGCLDWVDSTFGTMTAPLGSYFILGNHDWLQDQEPVRSRMTDAGWIDVARRVLTIDVRGEPLEIAGDESPWIGSHPQWPSTKSAFRLLLSHTPDHIDRAASEGVDLMLSGHTHGGQIVLPGIGPLLCPSRFGTRYASGQFQVGDTFLHVSRGISGKDPIRWNCLPEVTLIRLRSAMLET